jgi:AcrR family transcriptional regulator
MKRRETVKEKIGKRVENTQPLDRKAEIYRKAIDLFVEKGYDATSMAMIAKVSGMSKANLYYYCSSKENLLYQIYMQDLQTRLIPIVDQAERLLDPKERLVFFLRKFTLMCCFSQAPRVLIEELHNLNRNHRNEIMLIWRRGYEFLRDTIKELQQLGRGRKLRESFLAFLGTGMAHWTMYWWDYGRQTNAEELAETVVQIFSEGFFTENDGIDSKRKSTAKMKYE